MEVNEVVNVIGIEHLGKHLSVDDLKAHGLRLELAMQLEHVKGKKQYGYLPKKQKALVDKIVDQIEHIRSVSQAYNKWLELQDKVDGYYDDKPRERTPLSQQKVVFRFEKPENFSVLLRQDCSDSFDGKMHR